MEGFINDAYICTEKHSCGRIGNRIATVFLIFGVTLIPSFFLFASEPDIFTTLYTIEKVLVTVFILEYIVRIWSVKSPFRYVFSLYGFIDLVSLLPIFLYKAAVLSSFPTWILLFRVFRLFHFARITPEEETKDGREYRHFTLLPDERLQSIVQKHILLFVFALILPIAIASGGILTLFLFEFNLLSFFVSGLFFLIAGVLFIKSWLDFRYDTLIITDRRLLVNHRELFGCITNNLRYESMVDIIPDNNGFFKWLLGYGTISIKTATDSDVIIFNFIPHFAKIIQMISRNRQKAFDLHSKKRVNKEKNE